MPLKLYFAILYSLAILLASPLYLYADDKKEITSIENSSLGEAVPAGKSPLKLSPTQKQSYNLSHDLTTSTDEPTYEPGGGLITIGVGLLALLSGAISATAILITGGIFLVIGIVLLLFYKKLKKVNPFKSREGNIVAKIIIPLFFFILLIAVIGAIILAFVVALALLLAALLSTVVSPVVVALAIIGLGISWLLFNLIRYLIKRRKYKKSL